MKTCLRTSTVLRFHSNPLAPGYFVSFYKVLQLQQVQRISLYNQGPLLCKQALWFVISAFSS